MAPVKTGKLRRDCQGSDPGTQKHRLKYYKNLWKTDRVMGEDRNRWWGPAGTSLPQDNHAGDTSPACCIQSPHLPKNGIIFSFCGLVYFFLMLRISLCFHKSLARFFVYTASCAPSQFTIMEKKETVFIINMREKVSEHNWRRNESLRSSTE